MFLERMFCSDEIFKYVGPFITTIRISSLVYRDSTIILFLMFYNSSLFAMCLFLTCNFFKDCSNSIYRLDNPFDELNEMVDALDLDSMSYEEHSHTPYLLLYLKALKLWRKELQDETIFPDDYKKRKHFEKVIE